MILQCDVHIIGPQEGGALALSAPKVAESRAEGELNADPDILLPVDPELRFSACVAAIDL